ncbi:MAG: SRPBCC domain-containing protein [Chlorobiaceae bacterium]|nr:SRPBCC domain-containing protein [Chlorobiaceae bacterium]
MRGFRTEIPINASQERVWSVLSDFGQYPSWNPFIRKISGRIGVNEKLHISVKLSFFPPVSFEAFVDLLAPGERVGWNAVLFPGLLTARHWFELFKIDSCTTLLIHSEEFSGMFSGPVLAILSRAFNKGYASMNLALKKQSERS